LYSFNILTSSCSLSRLFTKFCSAKKIAVSFPLGITRGSKNQPGICVKSATASSDTVMEPAKAIMVEETTC
jgi:hypothetical protein